jgi:hypothetical protein
MPRATFPAVAIGAAFLGTALLNAADSNTTPVTFSNQVVRIFQEKCQDCHRPGTVAPMSLVTYEETRPWARSIKERVLNRNMPPWHIDTTYGVRHFSNDMSLSEDQVQTIVKWVESGSPKGDVKDLPPVKQWPNDDGWKLSGEFGRPPDLIIKSDPYTMPAQSQDQWWRPLTQIDLKEPRWVRAVEMRPGSNAGRKITHHALAHLVQDDPEARRLADPVGSGGARGPNEAGTLMEWAIGKNYDVYREGTGKLLLPGSHIWWDIHYHAVGEAIRDHVELGVWLYPKGEEPKYRTYLTGFQAVSRVGAALDIVPNSISATDGFTVLRAPARLENYQPHMHLRGKSMAMEAILPDGTIQPIASVGNFDFNWMTNYIFADDEAPVLPKGTVIHLKAWFDNTAAHKGNPDPDQWVGWGDRTVDEMAHAWVNVTYISEEDYAAWAAKHKKPAPALRGSN